MIREFGDSSRLKKQIGDQYRVWRDQFTIASDELLRPISERSVAQKASIAALQELDARGALTMDLRALVTSVIHMSLNRLFDSHSREQEMLVYEFARRYLSSQIARRTN